MGEVIMQRYQGKGVFGGIAIGKIHIYAKGEQQVKRYKITDTRAGWNGFRQHAIRLWSSLNCCMKRL